MSKLIFNFNSKEVKIKYSKNILGGKDLIFRDGKNDFLCHQVLRFPLMFVNYFIKIKKLNSKIIKQIKSELKVIEKEVKKFGD